MIQILLVAVGGAFGSVARYGMSLGAARLFGVGFPWGTLIINVLGSLALGMLAARFPVADSSQRLLLGIGVMGGFTTFSTFSLESVRLLQSDAKLGLLYILASVVLSVGACAFGLLGMRP